MRRTNSILLVLALMCGLLLISAQAVSGEVSAGVNPPTALKADAVSSSQINLTWTDNASNESGFIIERKTGNDAYNRINIVPENSTIFADTGLAANTTYKYRVKAYNNTVGSFVYSDYSNEVNATTNDTKPAAPSSLSASVQSSTSIKLTWTDNSGNETGFKIERKLSGGSYSQLKTVSANTTSYTDTGLSSSTKYYYKVRAYNDAGDSDYSNEVNATTNTATTNDTTLTAPSKLSASVQSATSIKLTWTDNSSNETGFKIERKLSGGSYSQLNKVSANTTSYTDTGLSSSTKYSYRVYAYNSSSNSKYSNEVNATTTNDTTLAAPSKLSASVQSATSIKLTWTDNSSNETGFKIERKLSGGSYSQLNMVSANTTSYTDTGLSGGTKYYYRVYAYNSSSNSKYSNEVNATTNAAATVIAKATVIKLAIDKSTFSVNDQLKTMDTAPVIRENRTLLPIRYIAESIGASVTWGASDKKATVSLNNKVIELWIGKNSALVNGQYMLIDAGNPDVTPIIIQPGRTMLPLRFISECLGCKVDWDHNKKEITVTYPAP
ncbi:MAG TPA: hypothetical protein DCK76_09080 [Desulfotomaculum sp.]|nr:MAG: Uncharacterized protein XD84_0072 [Desulfotomaculum sp. 46_80]HAG11515.1 hypothetical protein [Desulfotomaculum sp.]HBY04678.1 hypothetical protein [Desulfotomaculum sp.]